MAGRRTLREWRDRPLRILSPFETRSLLGVGESCGLYTCGVATEFAANSTHFWAMARAAKRDITGVKDA